MDFVQNSEVISMILKCRQGDNEAFEALVELYKPMLNHMIRRISLSVEEYFSEACMGLYKAALSYNVGQDEVTFGLYARICVSRRLFDILRREGADASLLNDDVDVDSIAVSGGIVSHLERKEESELFRARARELLSDYEYRVFVLWLAGYRAAFIAERLSTDVKSVENAKSRILKKLRGGMNV